MYFLKIVRELKQKDPAELSTTKSEMSVVSSCITLITSFEPESSRQKHKCTFFRTAPRCQCVYRYEYE